MTDQCSGYACPAARSMSALGQKKAPRTFRSFVRSTPLALTPKGKHTIVCLGQQETLSPGQVCLPDVRASFLQKP
jgi:hypothetical protein